MVTVIEDSIKLQGDEWYTKTWLPEGRPKAILVFVHGFSDHVNAYYEFFPTLAGRGIACYGYDRRGWGRSVRKGSDCGRTGPTSTVMTDIAAFVSSVLDRNSSNGNGDGPVFVMGHSMGGIDVATFMAAPAGSPREAIVRRIRGWIFEAPFFGFPAGEEPSIVKVVTGRLAGRLFPNMQLKNTIPAEYFSRDPVIVDTIRNDALCHDTGTLEGLAGLLDRVSVLASGGCVPHAAVTSIWIGHGTDDRAASYFACKKWFDSSSAAAVPDKTLRTYDGWLHQLHAEPEADRQLYYREVGDWILAHSEKEDGDGEPSSDAASATPPAPTPAEPASPLATEPADPVVETEQPAAVPAGDKEESKL
ncbi:alpha beta hydrolase fold family [Grosmannia clavigera kw1407]|uniref:Alpha beta hydrolase fold family n=1 Tax=Grosmannia clavigera (strain kw1407 / UAMH 11150) TaxID=655863 RepID=F0XM76_GROCL|nr:alpha beta hydrolase fold family [Grosmannia clavigera kw1407]EFX01053.1 alpha beta hydrolase fold family [Grosmannia clavigera kw1407]